MIDNNNNNNNNNQLYLTRITRDSTSTDWWPLRKNEVEKGSIRLEKTDYGTRIEKLNLMFCFLIKFLMKGTLI